MDCEGLIDSLRIVSHFSYVCCAVPLVWFMLLVVGALMHRIERENMV